MGMILTKLRASAELSARMYCEVCLYLTAALVYSKTETYNSTCEYVCSVCGCKTRIAFSFKYVFVKHLVSCSLLLFFFICSEQKQKYTNSLHRRYSRSGSIEKLENALNLLEKCKSIHL